MKDTASASTPSTSTSSPSASANAGSDSNAQPNPETPETQSQSASNSANDKARAASTTAKADDDSKGPDSADSKPAANEKDSGVASKSKGTQPKAAESSHKSEPNAKSETANGNSTALRTPPPSKQKSMSQSKSKDEEEKWIELAEMGLSNDDEIEETDSVPTTPTSNKSGKRDTSNSGSTSTSTSTSTNNNNTKHGDTKPAKNKGQRRGSKFQILQKQTTDSLASASGDDDGDGDGNFNLYKPPGNSPALTRTGSAGSVVRTESVIAQAEAKDFDALVYWDYEVVEDKADEPSHEAVVIAVHTIEDQLTHKLRTCYDIRYNAGKCCARRINLVPESYLSTPMPLPLPYAVGTRVLTSELKPRWVNHKVGESSSIKPTYFSNGKARCYAERSLLCLHGGYVDEPPLGWSADLAVDAEQQFYQRPKNKFRKAMVDLVSHPAFEGTILVLIVLNSVNLAVLDMNPHYVDAASYIPYSSVPDGCCPILGDGDSDTTTTTTTAAVSANASLDGLLCMECPTVNVVSGRIDLFFTAAYTLEMVLKIIAMGFFAGPGTYLANGWNILDFIVVVTGLIEVCCVCGDLLSSPMLFVQFAKTKTRMPPMRDAHLRIAQTINARCTIAPLHKLPMCFCYSIFPQHHIV